MAVEIIGEPMKTSTAGANLTGQPECTSTSTGSFTYSSHLVVDRAARARFGAQLRDHCQTHWRLFEPQES
jgi:hypothetical protein